MFQGLKRLKKKKKMGTASPCSSNYKFSDGRVEIMSGLFMDTSSAMKTVINMKEMYLIYIEENVLRKKLRKWRSERKERRKKRGRDGEKEEREGQREEQAYHLAGETDTYTIIYNTRENVWVVLEVHSAAIISQITKINWGSGSRKASGRQ